MTKKKWKREDITPEILRQLLHLDEETGNLYWKERGPEWFSGINNTGKFSEEKQFSECKKWNRNNCGKECFINIGGKGELVGTIFNMHFKKSRVLMQIKSGEKLSSDKYVVNGNALERGLATSIKAKENKTTGYRGVDYDSVDFVYRAVFRGRYIGRYPTPIEAARAYDAKAYELYGQHARLNFPEDYGLTDTKTDDIPEGYFD